MKGGSVFVHWLVLFLVVESHNVQPEASGGGGGGGGGCGEGAGSTLNRGLWGVHSKQRPLGGAL